MAVVETSFVKESRDRYLTYALSVVSSRALPDIRDGLKPVQRRILFDMFKNLKLLPESSHRKSAAVVGGVLARFHPHGDTACYEAMVRMAQDFSLRYPLIDGQGNFGSLDGDSPAAYRYTEVKLLPLALDVVGEIDEETVPFRDNFDGTQQEPVVLPSRVPNLLINGAVGIAVGMATSIPPHNLREVVKGLIALAGDPGITLAGLCSIIKAPDFPTGCSILNSRSELKEIYKSGRGSIRMRGDWYVEEKGRGRQQIVISTVPYSIDKSQLVEKIASHIIARKIPQIVDIRDESTTEVRIVMELAGGADPDVAMAYLYKNTPLESNFAVNLTALVPSGRDGAAVPQLLSLKEMLEHFLEFRLEVVEKRLRFEKKMLEKRIHILEGFAKVFDRLDEVIRIVRRSEGRQDAAGKLKTKLKLSEVQAFAVVDMRIYQISKTSISDIRAELSAKSKRVDEIGRILKSKKRMKTLVVKDLEELASKFGDKRRSLIIKDNVGVDFDAADYLVEEDVYAIVTRDGWIKRIRQTNELNSTRLREGDLISRAHAATTLDSVAFVTNKGYFYVLKVSDFPASSGYGSPVQKIFKFRDGEAIVESFLIKSGKNGQAGEQGELFDDGPEVLEKGDYLILVTRRGTGFCLQIQTVEGIKRNGRRMIKLRAGDELASVCFYHHRLCMITEKGSSLCIDSSEIPVHENPAVGVALMKIRRDDELRAAVAFHKEAKIELTLRSGKTREITSETAAHGRRGLMGKRVVTGQKVVSAKVL